MRVSRGYFDSTVLRFSMGSQSHLNGLRVPGAVNAGRRAMLTNGIQGVGHNTCSLADIEEPRESQRLAW